MLKKSVIWRVLLLLVVIVMANFYLGCVHKHYAPGSPQYQTKEGAEIKDQAKQIEALKKEMEELKKQQ